ncbi:MAG: hypothetical protein NTX79_08870 [Candidatus Micrarchaeota archaeon]|nr:hypothetical protein [Candidatus Micrarchaeota archaeon]
MALPLDASDLISPLLLVKALLAWLAFFIFIYYRHYWNAAKSRLPVHFFFTKWRAVKHAYLLGYASLGFALGFSLELFGVPLGMSPEAARIASSVFEAASLFSILYVFFSLALEDVPHFQRISDSSAQTVAPPAAATAPKNAQARQKPKKRKVSANADNLPSAKRLTKGKKK